MFIRKKTSPNSPHTNVQIVESIRTDDKVRQKVLRQVGVAKTDAQLEKLLELAEVIKEELIQTRSHQGSLFSPKQCADMTMKNKNSQLKGQSPLSSSDPLMVDLKKCREEARFSLGVQEAYGDLFDRVGFNRLLGVRRQSSGNILRELTLARISQPKSKRASVLDLSKDCGIHLSLDRVYQSMDYIDEKTIAKIKQCSATYTQSLFKEPLRVLFYDTTTLYFCSQKEDEESLRQKGYSKDGKSHFTQVVLGLVMTESGLPVSYEVYSGNTYEGHTLLEALEGIMRTYPDSHITVVADAGLLNRANTQALQAKNIPYILGYRLKSSSKPLKDIILDKQRYKPLPITQQAKNIPYILGYRLKSSSKPLKDIILDKQRYKPLPITQHKNPTKISDSTVSYQEIDNLGQRVIVTHSEKRAKKDRLDREKYVKKLQERLNKNPKASSLLRSGVSKYLRMENKEGVAHLDEEKIQKMARWDGLHVITAYGCEKLSADELLSQYKQLWQIEAGFRTNKHDLKIRPIFHWVPRRIHAHLAICYMAFCCVQYLRYRLEQSGHSMSAECIRMALNHLQMSILKDKSTQKTYVVPSRATTQSQQIYRALNLTWDEMPYEYKKE